MSGLGSHRGRHCCQHCWPSRLLGRSCASTSKHLEHQRDDVGRIACKYKCAAVVPAGSVVVWCCCVCPPVCRAESQPTATGLFIERNVCAFALRLSPSVAVQPSARRDFAAAPLSFEPPRQGRGHTLSPWMVQPLSLLQAGWGRGWVTGARHHHNSRQILQQSGIVWPTYHPLNPPLPSLAPLPITCVPPTLPSAVSIPSLPLEGP